MTPIVNGNDRLSAYGALQREPGVALRWAFYAFMFVIPFETSLVFILPNELYGWASPARIVAPFVLFFFVVDPATRPWRSPPGWICVLLLVLLFFVRGMLDGFALAGTVHLLQFAIMFGVSYNVFLFPRTATHALLSFFSAACISAFCALLGIGVDPELARTSGRVAAFYNDPNVFGKVLTLAALVGIGVTQPRMVRLRASSLVLWALAVALIGALASTASRGASLSLIVGVIAMAMAKGGAWRRLGALASAAVLVAVALWFFITQETLSARWRVTLEERGERGGTAQRLDYWINAAAMIGERPILGWGVASRRELALRLKGEAEERIAHNTWLEIGTDVGLGGILLYGLLMLVALGRAWRAPAGREGVMPWAIFVSLVCFDLVLGNPDKMNWVFLAYVMAAGTVVPHRYTMPDRPTTASPSPLLETSARGS